MVNIVNQSALSIGGFRHYSGLLPANPAAAGNSSASVRIFHVAAANATTMFRGDIITFADSTHGTQGAGDLLPNIGTPTVASVVVGNGGGALLGNSSIAPNAARWVPGDTTSVIAGVCVGFGPISLYMAKNGFQFVPASTEAWLFVETDEQVECTITVPTVPGSAFTQLLAGGADVQANAGFQSTRFGVSGLSLNPAIATTSTLPLRVLGSGEQIGNDPTIAGFVAKVMFNQNRHFRGGAPLVLD